MGIPQFVGIERIDAHTARNKRAAGVCDTLKRAFNAVKYIVQNARRKSDGYGGTCSFYTFARLQAGCLFIYLDGSHVFVEGYDLADQFLISYVHHF